MARAAVRESVTMAGRPEQARVARAFTVGLPGALLALDAKLSGVPLHRGALLGAEVFAGISGLLSRSGRG
jgi:hypothetical protein